MAIIPMKRATFVTLVHKGEDLLRHLQRLGVVHPEHIRALGESPEVDRLDHQLHVERVVIKSLESRKPAEGEPVLTRSEPPSFLEIEGWLSKERKLIESVSSLKRAIDLQGLWGEFDHDAIAGIADAGVYVQLWAADAKAFDSIKFPKGTVVRTASKSRRIMFVTASFGRRISLRGAEEISPPDRDLKSLKEELQETAGERDVIAGRIDDAAGHLYYYRAENEKMRLEHDFRVALERAFGDQWIQAFCGWIPESESERVDKFLKTLPYPVVMRLRDPAQEDAPPVLTRNPWMVMVFEPLLHLLGMPNYGGVDPALFFAPFMMLFFGVCLGDAGYGLMMIAASFLMKRLSKRTLPALAFVGNITLLFGIATTIWGAITGSVFGIAFEQRRWILLDVAYRRGDPMLLFKISVGLGIAHMTVAFVLAMISSANWQRRLAKLGMILVIWGAVLGVLRIPMWWILVSLGLAHILFMSAESGGLLKRLGLGLWNIYGLTGLLGDVMSYARLFGLGIATAAIASVVNELAGQVRDVVPLVGVLLAVLVLLVGHAFNLAIGIVGALVHPARLHAVEAFPKFVELNGIPYKPLKKSVEFQAQSSK